MFLPKFNALKVFKDLRARGQITLRLLVSDTENQQSTPAVIAEASQSTRYGTGSVAETAIRDLLTQTQRGILAEFAKKLSDVVMVVVKKKEENDNKNNIKQQGTTNGVPRMAREKCCPMLSKVVMVVVKYRTFVFAQV